MLCLFSIGATGDRALLTQDELRSGLCQFTRIDGWYHHWLNQFVFSDGVKWLSDQCDCRWLLTDIAFFQLRIRATYPQLEPFQIWHLRDLVNGRGRLECRSGNNKLLIDDDVEVGQFILPEITLWLVNGLLLLPNEYSGTRTPVSNTPTMGLKAFS